MCIRDSHHRIGPASPWGGFKESGIGRENGIDCYKDYTRLKNVIVKTTSDQFDWFDGTATDKRYSLSLIHIYSLCRLAGGGCCRRNFVR